MGITIIDTLPKESIQSFRLCVASICSNFVECEIERLNATMQPNTVVILDETCDSVNIYCGRRKQEIQFAVGKVPNGK